MTRLRSFIAVLLSLVLVGAQQMAFAHMIGHLGASTVSVATGGDEGHGEALSLSHVCTTCVGASALMVGAPCGVPPPLTFEGCAVGPTSAWAVLLDSSAATPYLARAPPLVL